jgi:hypothetical protein
VGEQCIAQSMKPLRLDAAGKVEAAGIEPTPGFNRRVGLDGNSLSDPTRRGALVVVSQLPDFAVVGGGECRHPFLAHTSEYDQGRSVQAWPVALKETEHAKLLAFRAGYSDLVVAGHFAVHGFPHSSAREARRRRFRYCRQNRLNLRLDCDWATVEKLFCRHFPRGIFVVDDSPRHRRED